MRIPSTLPLSLLLLFTLSAPATAGVPDYDFQWSTISDPGNPGYFGPNDFNLGRLGRGDVDYEYRMSTREVSTAQWIEFINTFAPDSADFANKHGSFSSFGAWFDPSYSGPGRRYILNPNNPEAGNLPVSRMSFRTAALYMNWLHHGKPSDLALIQDGAYEASTFGSDGVGGFTDQIVHSPGAKYWIPTVSEWLKAVHWDPNKHGSGQGGWWTNQYSSDESPTPGFPGEPGAMTSAGIDLSAQGAMSIPLGSYPDAQSPWGLLDTSGGESEMLAAWWNDEHNLIANDGQDAGRIGFGERADEINSIGSISSEHGATWVGLRIASAVPAPASVFVLCGGTTILCSRRKRACIRRRQDYLFMQP